MKPPPLLQVLTQLILIAVAVLGFVNFARHRGRRQLLLAVVLGSLVAPIFLGALVLVPGAPVRPILIVSSTVLVLHPYLLLLIVWELVPKRQAVDLAYMAGSLIMVVLVFIFTVPVPQNSMAPTPAFVICVLYFLMEAGSAWLLFRQRAKLSGVSLRRTMLVAMGAGFLALLFLLVGIALLTGNPQMFQELLSLLSLFAGVAFYLGFTPPRWLRQNWQHQAVHAFFNQTIAAPINERGYEALKRYKPLAENVLDASVCVLLQWEHQESTFVPWEHDSQDLPKHSRLTPTGHIQRAWESKEATALLATELQDELQPLLQAHHSTICKLIPIVHAHYQWGLLIVGLQEQPMFPEDDLAMLQLTATQVAATLEHTELLQAQKRFAEQQQETIDALRRASRLKSEFLANMSHELRTPLNAIIGFSELLYDQKVGDLDEDQRDCLDNILSSAEHLLTLINDILDLSKIEAGKIQLEPETISLAQMVETGLNNLAPLAHKEQIALVSTLPGDLPEAFLDPARFTQVLLNLVSNGIKFNRPGGQVSVALSACGPGRFQMVVEDTGIGIAETDQPRLFHKFEQLDSSNRKRFSGTGLGLALTRQLVEAQGGEIFLTSTLGEGSTFTVELPLQTPQSPTAKDE